MAGRLDGVVGVPSTAGVVTDAVGTVVSMRMVLFADSDPAPPGTWSVSVASFVAASRIVPPFVTSDVVAA